MRDLQFIDKTSYNIQPYVIGKTNDRLLMLYQKILVLLLTQGNTEFRQYQGTQLISLLQGANIPAQNFLQHLGQISCNQVLQQLDSEDRQLISNLSASVQNGSLFIVLKTEDQQIKGILA